MADITAVFGAVIVADVVIGAQLQKRASGQKSDQFAKGAQEATPNPALVNQRQYHCRQGK
jgi:2-keto-3-deoxy-galactonokinase